MHVYSFGWGENYSSCGTRSYFRYFDREILQNIQAIRTASPKRRKDVEQIGEEERKSIVVTKNKIYYSPISSSTLKKRAHHFLTN